jgi:hypothetical protein
MSEFFPHVSPTEVNGPDASNRSTFFDFSSFSSHIAGNEVQTDDTEKAAVDRGPAELCHPIFDAGGLWRIADS